jgi:IS30 family transposase
VVSREIGRNGGRDQYGAVSEQECADQLRTRSKVMTLVEDSRLRDAVADYLRDDFSPQQIMGRLRVDYPDDDTEEKLSGDCLQWIEGY